jgi:type VI secretion system protein ImpK
MSASFADTLAGHTMDLDLTKSIKKKADLTTLCTDIFLIVIRMREAEDLGSPEALRKLILHYLDLFKKNCRAMSFDPSLVNDAVYALVALLDETVMSTPGECRNFWVTNPVQLELFGDNLAGEGFFKRLEKLMADPERMKDVLEIYYLCLSLGFEGKYKLGNASERNVAIDNLARLLLKAGRHSITGLSPHGRRVLTKDLFKQGGGKIIPLWAVCTSAVILFIIWWGIMYYLAGESLERALSVIK